MNWITKIIKAGEKIKTAIRKRATKSEMAASKYISCHGTPVEKKLIEQNNFVCPECNYHHFINPSQRFTMMFGENNWKKINSPLVKDPDPYNWVDTKKYTDRLKEAKKITGQDNAILSCEAKINNIDVVVSAVNFKWIGGSISLNEGENVLAAINTAIEKKCPYIFISSSGGMRMMTNMLSLMQMTRMTIGINELKKNNLPYIVVITNPSTGGLSASISSIGDICIGETGATMAFAGRRIVEATSQTELPDNFQTVEWQKENGQVDIVLDRKDILPTIEILLSILLKRNSVISTEENETSEDSQTNTRAAS
tara:strand:- start:5687 stop:6619 length:933 start_codon:yes stop_codon:yes gene_type:complete